MEKNKLQIDFKSPFGDRVFTVMTILDDSQTLKKETVERIFREQATHVVEAVLQLGCNLIKNDERQI